MVGTFQKPTFAALIGLLTFALLTSASSRDEKKSKPCTIRSPTTDRFFDLTPISVVETKDSKEDEPLESWHAKGHDYPANFTINFCAPVVEELKDVVGVDESRWNNIGAFYNRNGKIYSIGEMQDEPVFRGRKLVLNYTHGSPCSSDESPTSLAQDLDEVSQKKTVDGGDDNKNNGDKNGDDGNDNGNGGGDGEGNGNKGGDSGGDGDKHDDDDEGGNGNEKKHKCHGPEKSTIISLLCEKDPLAAKAAVAFVGTLDECTYFFEVRSAAACGGIEIEKQSLGPAGVFGVIAMIAIIVYFVGGCMYQRTVMHQRGLRQIPNYALWAGIFGFFKDIVIILISTVSRFFPSRRGYSRVAISGNGRGRNNHSDDENRLIDQLDEEWDD